MTIIKHPRLKKGKKIEISKVSGCSFFALTLSNEGVDTTTYSECDIAFHVCWGSETLEANYAADITQEKNGKYGSRTVYNTKLVPEAFIDKAIKMGFIDGKENN